jgi:TonB dependent receptor-like, beta-barrel
MRPAAVVLALALPLGAGEARAGAVTRAGDLRVTVGSTCPRLQLECADGRIATRWVLDSFARDLPSGRGAWALLETVEPAAIVDRIDGAGLHLDEPGLFAMRGASWTQNAVLLDGVDVTDPLHGGTPLFLPDVDSLRSIEVTSALAPADYSAPGVTLALTSRAPAASWRGTAQAYGLGSGLQSREAPGEPPSIARFGSLADAGVLLSGPVAGERLGLLAAGRLARVRRFERSDTTALDARLVSGLVQLTWRAGEGDTLRLGGVAQALERPLSARVRFAGDAVTEHADAFGATSTWNHEGDRVTAAAFASLWTGTFVPQTEGYTANGPVERLRDGPVPDLVFSSHSRRLSWSAGGRVAFRPEPLGGLWHAPRFGVIVGRASVTEAHGVDGPVPETVDGLAARVWDYTWPGPDSRRHALDVGAWASERLTWRERLFVEAGLRLERTTGAAEGAAQGVSWTSLLPRVSARLRLTDFGRLSLFGGWGEYRHRLLLDSLAFGDPNAPRASVYRWTDANGDGLYDSSERGPLVARVGPGDGSVAGIDPGLQPPRTRELVAGLEASPGEGWVLAIIGFDRRETDLIESVNVGVPISDYVVRYLPDPGGDIVGSQDDQLLPVFDRKPESFGLDRYRLTNPAGLTGQHQGVELRVEKALGARFALFAGATASRTEIRGGNRGFRVTENDQGVVGELFDNPNADTYSLGRGFFDRAFTIKIAAAWRAPHGFRLGVVTRYQDGQPFGRLVVVPDLAQGPEAIPATSRGQSFGRAATVDPEGRPLTADGHRFTYTLTLDARIEKGFDIGARRLALVAEAFNLLGLRHEVEENPVWGAGFRDPTAVQPPRVVRLGARFDF